MFAAKLQRPTLLSLASVLVIAGALQASNALAWSFNWGGDATVNGSGNVVSTTRVVSGFQSVEVSVPGTVKIVQGDAEGLAIKTDDNIAALIETVVEGESLRIRFVNKTRFSRIKQLDITVFAKSLKALAIAGSGTIHTDKLKAERLKVSIEGSGDMVLGALDIGQMVVSVAGSGNVRGDGKAESLTTNIAGSGDVQLGHVMAKTSKISIAGSGNAQVWATDNLKVSIAGSGDVRYFGDPTVSSSIAGAGNVQRLGVAPPPKKL